MSGWMHKGWRAALRALVVAAGLAGAAAHAADVLPAPVREALERTGLPEQALSVVVMPAERGPARLRWRDEQPRTPASTIKVVTTLVALDRLGPAHRWRTGLWASRPPVDGVLAGPLHVRGDGDPDFTYEHLLGLLRQLREQGVHTLQGDVVLDRRAFRPARPDLAEPPFDETPHAHYNVVPDALLLNDNLLLLWLRADDRGLQVRTSPPMERLEVDRRGVVLVDAPCTGWDRRGFSAQVEASAPRRIVLRLQGSFPKGCEARTETSALDRNRYWEAVWRALWQELGGRWQGTVRDGDTPEGALLLAERLSDPLADGVRRVNKASSNPMARSLYLALGAQALQGRPEDTAAAAAQVVREWFAARELPAEGLVMDNGSGLSRRERATAWQLAQVLRAGVRGDWAPEFLASLPIAGLDGTLRRRLRDPATAGRVRLKTGSLRDAAGVAGVVRDAQARDWIVVALVNDPEGRDARPVLDAVVDWVARTPPER